MPKRSRLSIFDTAYDVLAYVLKLHKHPTQKSVYIARDKQLYRRTKWGFEPLERYNLRIQLRRKERKIDYLNDELDNLTEEYNLLLKRKTGLINHLHDADERLKEARREKGFLKKHLKEVLDQNIALDKRLQRMQNQEENNLLQIDKLKRTKDNLLESNTSLSDKTRQQKAQIASLHKMVEDLKNKVRQQIKEEVI